MRIALLSTVFIGEYGVTRILENQLPYLLADGHQVDLYACDLDRSLVPAGVRAVRVPTHFRGVALALKAGNYDVVVACTDPFYKIVADLKLDAVTVAYEHGYIPAELTIPEEREQHRKMVEARIGEIYPAFTAVVTISRYAAEYIGWPAARVLYNGGDHFAKLLPAGSLVAHEGPVRVLMVTRYRTTEWLYKGLDDLCRLKKDLGDSYEVTVVGGGDAVTCAKLTAAGVAARAAISDSRKMAELYADCDVLVSFSKCENFNLPLVEAGFAHRPALALAVCAHPEVTPFVFESYEGIRDYLKNATRETLDADGEKMFQFVEKRFRSEENGKGFAALLRELCPNPAGKRAGCVLGLYHAFWDLRDFVRNRIYRKLRRR
ncbi:glycosyltransferase family 4 protein [Fibrobacter sp. UBA4309]|uniref:glycosyltransferase family 4 protein n=1 Tax=Fibrobacter sp. UBA4309 TaxID=1946537 RepID=UPI0025C171D6|nr:glycosyltransferase family 4 protein [Fibrobacter sp. UBA4309]